MIESEWRPRGETSGVFLYANFDNAAFRVYAEKNTLSFLKLAVWDAGFG